MSDDLKQHVQELVAKRDAMLEEATLETRKLSLKREAEMRTNEPDEWAYVQQCVTDAHAALRRILSEPVENREECITELLTDAFADVALALSTIKEERPSISIARLARITAMSELEILAMDALGIQQPGSEQ